MHFDRLVSQHKDAVYRQMVRMCGNADDAEDVLGEALLKAYRAMDQLGDEEAFRGWLAIIARRTCGRLKRREALAPVWSLAELADFGVEPTDTARLPDVQAIEAETKSCLLAVIASLPPIYRESNEACEADCDYWSIHERRQNSYFFPGTAIRSVWRGRKGEAATCR